MQKKRIKLFVPNLRIAKSKHSKTRISFFINLQQQEQDPTNLYIANLPPEFDEDQLSELLQPHGLVISSRILRFFLFYELVTNFPSL